MRGASGSLLREFNGQFPRCLLRTSWSRWSCNLQIKVFNAGSLTVVVSVCADPAYQLQLQLKDLAAREKAIHAQLAVLNEDDECL